MIISFNSNIWGGINIYIILRKQVLLQNQQSAPDSFDQSHRKRYSVKVGQSLGVTIKNIRRTVSHDHFIQFQHLEAELISTLSE